MTMAGETPDSLKRVEVLRSARELAYDDYMVAVLSPADSREDLIALAALFGELARIPLQVSDPALGEIRLQWWRDALAGEARTGHPVADAVIALASRRDMTILPAIEPVLEARSAELYAEPFPTDDAFQTYVAAPETAAFALRASLLGVRLEDWPVLSSAARTLGLSKAAARLPHLFARGRYPLPAARISRPNEEQPVDEEHLRAAVRTLIAEAAAEWQVLRTEINGVGPALKRVILPAALAGPYLRAMQAVGHDVLRDIAEPSPLERTARLWLAARLGRF